MNGYLALLGSGEYLPVMRETDQYLLENSAANGRKPKVVCLPTAAGREGDDSVARWMQIMAARIAKSLYNQVSNAISAFHSKNRNQL